MKLPENEATSTRGVPPFVTDEKAVNDYYPYGMIIKDRCYQGSNYNYSYNKGSEKDNEIYTNQEGRAITTFYREGDLSGVRWWSIDPKACEQPWQSPYNMMDANPIFKNDPLGDNPGSGAVVAAFTEYASIVGGKMLFEGKTFKQANDELDLKDFKNIGLSIPFGALSGFFDGGVVNFLKFMKSPTNQKIVIKLIVTGLEVIESIIKDIVNDEDVNVHAILYGILAKAGMGNLIKKTNVFKEVAETATNNASVATKRSGDLAKRTKPKNKLVEKEKKKAQAQTRTAKTFKILDKTAESVVETGGKITADKTTVEAKKVDEKKEK